MAPKPESTKPGSVRRHPGDFTSGPMISISAFMSERSSTGVVVVVSTPLACSRRVGRERFQGDRHASRKE
jgi:hypothetical protein